MKSKVRNIWRKNIRGPLNKLKLCPTAPVVLFFLSKGVIQYNVNTLVNLFSNQNSIRHLHVAYTYSRLI